MQTVTRCYRQAADAVLSGSYSPELAARLKEKLATVFNRGFWDGYYQGARLGEWSEVYGNRATRTKTYVGRITNWYEKLGMAEITLETGTIAVGSHLLVTGPTTGVVECDVSELRLDAGAVPSASKGDVCSVPLATKVRRSDKVFLFE